MKDLMSRQKFLKPNDIKGISNVGILLEAVKDAKGDKFEDARVTKEMFQKIQYLQAIIFIFVLAGSGLCCICVRLAIK